MEKYLSQIAGDNVKRVIKNSDFETQENFAFAFGADVRTVSRWLNNGIKNLDTLQEIAEFLEVDVLSLLKQS